jgi:hypothetical protein
MNHREPILRTFENVAAFCLLDLKVNLSKKMWVTVKIHKIFAEERFFFFE